VRHHASRFPQFIRLTLKAVGSVSRGSATRYGHAESGFGSGRRNGQLRQPVVRPVPMLTAGACFDQCHASEELKAAYLQTCTPVSGRLMCLTEPHAVLIWDHPYQGRTEADGSYKVSGTKILSPAVNTT